MLFFMTLFACDEFYKTNYYDISSTIMVQDENGTQINMDDVEICQIFRAEDYDTRTEWQLFAEQCDSVDIEDGLVMLPNWEGEYFGPDVDIFVELRHEGEVYPGELLDSDDDVWCDNTIAESYDEDGNVISYASVCEENYERYLLWSLTLPSEIFSP